MISHLICTALCCILINVRFWLSFSMLVFVFRAPSFFSNVGGASLSVQNAQIVWNNVTGGGSVVKCSGCTVATPVNVVLVGT